MRFSNVQLAAALLAPSVAATQNFTISNGQIFTPGFVVVDSPQPGTPMGGETIQVAMDVTADGKLPQPPYDKSSPSLIYNITLFMSSYKTGRNFTMANSTEAPSGNIIDQEIGSTVKHVNWLWPDCLVGDGQPTSKDSDRGSYNISIRQYFRLNGKDHYTVFDLPISVTNSIPADPSRPSCDSINNPLLPPDEIISDSSIGTLFAPGDSTTVSTDDNSKSNGKGNDSGSGKGSGSGNGSGSGSGSSDSGLGSPKTQATPEDGLGSGAPLISWRTSAMMASGLWAVAFLFL